MQDHATPLTLSERADELEEQMMNELNERIATKSVLFNMADGKVEIEGGAALQAKHPGKTFLMGADPRLPKMPDKPTLIDFFKLRFASTPSAAERDPCVEGRAGRENHPGLPAARHRRGELHPLRSRLLGAQLIEPYVDEEVSWAIRVHQALRFFPDLGRLRISRDVRQVFRRGLPAGALYRRGVRARP